MKKKGRKIVIDIATIYPGQGGAGGGIWSYSANLLTELDDVLKSHQEDCPEFICLANKTFSLPLENIRIRIIRWNLQIFLFRFIYIHIYLPVYCLLKGAVLHKTYFETPFLHFSGMLVTIHDCMADFYLAKGYIRGGAGDRLKTWYFRFINRRAIRSSRMIVTPSQAVKDEIVRNYRVEDKKIIVTPLAAANRKVTQASRTLHTTEKTINLYCVAAFHRHKGHLRLLDIFDSMMMQYPLDAKLFFRGHIDDMDYYHEVRERISRSPVKDRIEIVQYRQDSSLADIYSNTDWVILLSEYEGFGLPVIEAQAFYKPVICSDIPVFREVAGGSAVLLPVEMTADQAASKLHQLLIDEHAEQKWIALGNANAKRYSWQKFGKQMIGVYNKLF